ncbi:MAG TPA: hypothetical protein VMW01_13955 [Williamwhitmania sp.]|nr:hypothetical protein [Williamwhitmania sp.]
MNEDDYYFTPDEVKFLKKMADEGIVDYIVNSHKLREIIKANAPHSNQFAEKITEKNCAFVIGVVSDPNYALKDMLDCLRTCTETKIDYLFSMTDTVNALKVMNDYLIHTAQDYSHIHEIHRNDLPQSSDHKKIANSLTHVVGLFEYLQTQNYNDLMGGARPPFYINDLTLNVNKLIARYIEFAPQPLFAL